MNENTEINRATGGGIALSVLIIAAGMVAIIVPPASGIAVTILIGWLLIFSGAAHLVYAWHRQKAGGVLWGTLLGVLYIGAGIYMLLRPVAGLESLTLVLAIYLVLESILEFVLGFQLRAMRGSGWLLWDGVITLILAIMVWRAWPASTAWAVGTLVGISMIFSGISRLMIGLAVRRAAHPLGDELPAH